MAESTNNSAASMAASIPIKIENISLPGFGPQSQSEFNPAKYRVKYLKVEMDDPGSVAELEEIETKGLVAREIVVLNKEKFTFMDKYFLVVTYLMLI